MSSSLIELLIFDFHIAHMVIEIRTHNLSESLLKSPLKVRAADPLIGPRVMGSQSLLVDLYHIFSVVSHASACLLLAHSSHMCCLVSIISIFCTFLQKEHFALLVCPGILLQKLLHLIFPVSMFLMWSVICGGILSACMPFSSFLFVGCSLVTFLYLIFHFV